MNDRWCHEWLVNEKVKHRNEYIYSKYPQVPIEFMAQKYHITPLYILFILKRHGVELIKEHEMMVSPYVTKDYPFPKEGNGYIYKISNLVDDMIYVGQTNQSLIMRMRQHHREYEESIYAGRKLHQHFNLLGVDKFHIELIEECILKDLNDKEIYWIDYYGSHQYGLNGTPGGEYIRQEFF